MGISSDGDKMHCEFGPSMTIDRAKTHSHDAQISEASHCTGEDR